MEKIISENVQKYKILSIQRWGFRSSEKVVLAQSNASITECISDRVILYYDVGVGKYEGRDIFDKLIVGDIVTLRTQEIETQYGTTRKLIYEE